MTDNLTADVHDDVANSKSVPHLTMLEYVTKWNKQLELDFKNEDVCIISKINEGTVKSLKKLDLARDESKLNSPFPTTLKEGGNTKLSYMKMLRKLYRLVKKYELAHIYLDYSHLIILFVPQTLCYQWSLGLSLDTRPLCHQECCSNAP